MPQGAWGRGQLSQHTSFSTIRTNATQTPGGVRTSELYSIERQDPTCSIQVWRPLSLMLPRCQSNEIMCTPSGSASGQGRPETRGARRNLWDRHRHPPIPTPMYIGPLLHKHTEWNDTGTSKAHKCGSRPPNLPTIPRQEERGVCYPLKRLHFGP